MAKKRKDLEVNIISLHLADMGNFRTQVLSREEEINLFERYHKGDMDAYNHIAEANVKLGFTYVKRVYKPKVDDFTFMDLVQESYVGMLQAIPRFDLSRNCKFSTCAMQWIRQSTSRAYESVNKDIKVSGDTMKKVNFVMHIFEQMTESGTPPTDDEVAKYINDRNLWKDKISTKEVTECMETFHALIAKSLFTPVGEDQEDTYMDMIPSDKYNPEDEVIQTEFSAEMLALCKKCLDDRELFVITHKFELDGQPAMKQKAMAEYLGVSRTLIGNLEKRALRKLRAQITRTRKKYPDSW